MKAKIGTSIREAASFLNTGNLVAIPTETVYGLAANALDEKAVAQIFSVKNRPSFDPLIVHISGIDQVSKWVKSFPKKAALLAKHFWPGPLTLILPKKEIIPDIVTSGHGTIGLRVPNHPTTINLLNHIDFPLAAPSANPFGFVSPTTSQHVQDQLGEKIPYILEGGPANVGVESTIVKFENEEPIVLRVGGVSIEKIEEILGEKITNIKLGSSKPDAPGMLLSHYNPGKKVIICNDLEAEVRQQQNENFGIISFATPFPNLPNQKLKVLSPAGDLNEAARNLFGALRHFHAMHDVDVILTEKFPDKGLGKAINDRLKRAAN